MYKRQTVEIRRGGKFSVEQAKANEIPLKYWNPLQKGESIEAGGKVYTPDMVLGQMCIRDRVERSVCSVVPG